MNKPFQTRPTTRPMQSEAVRFHNGMIVTDTDLTAAMTYAVQLLATTNRAVHGCGVACGFRFAPDPDLCGQTKPCDPCGEDGDPRMAYPGFRIQVRPGSAIDCYGMPIELCEPVLVDLPPGACGCGDGGDVVCIAVRRVSSDEAPRGDCCGETAGGHECTRQRDHVELRAFRSDELPKHICARKDPGEVGSDCGCGCGGSGHGDPEGSDRAPRPCGPSFGSGQHPLQNRICDCLTRCDPCDCCGEGWILLGCVELCETGIPVDMFQQGSEACGRVYARRRWIRTVECLCGTDLSTTAYTRDQSQIITAGMEKLKAGVEYMKMTERQKATILRFYEDGPERFDRLLNDRRTEAKLILGLRTEAELDRLIETVKSATSDGRG